MASYLHIYSCLSSTIEIATKCGNIMLCTREYVFFRHLSMFVTLDDDKRLNGGIVFKIGN